SEGSSHGYELLEAIQTLGMTTAEAGGLYRSLRSMDEDGLVRSWWEPSESGPARRTYEITRAGSRALDVHMTEIETVATLLAGLVEQHRSALDPT
ncbi:MAG: PadR family transcriptional regulator, partial [Acidimicrobiales bacterium]|nr:PadR family transcriptional regulator [Acidimicrobiales bacterium]